MLVCRSQRSVVEGSFVRVHFGFIVMEKFVKRFKLFLHEEDGPTAIEYALMVSLIAVAVIASVGQVANQTKNTFNTSGTAINTALSP